MPNDVTHILQAIVEGDRAAAEQLLPLVYDELRRLAARLMAAEKPGQTLNATALVHEAYLRLVGSTEGDEKKWDGRGHFFAAAAEAMRRILVENARRKSRVKHGGELNRVPLEDADFVSEPASDVLLALDEALTRFAVEEPEAAKIVELRYFAGLSIDEAADALGVSAPPRTAIGLMPKPGCGANSRRLSEVRQTASRKSQIGQPAIGRNGAVPDGAGDCDPPILKTGAEPDQFRPPIAWAVGMMTS